jgi:DNA-binding transcriptional MerR regulator
MPTDTYSIGDLARLTGVNVRTIRYYLAQGLLPASGESGPGAHYGEGHLDRLRLTKRLQQQHLPLAQIRRRLAELNDADVASLVSAAEPEPPSPTTSALDYVRAVLGGPVTPRAPARTPPPVAAPRPAARAALFRPAGYAAIGMVSEESEPHALPANASEAPLAEGPMPAADVAADLPPTATEPPTTERSQWERLSLTPDIELHIRRPLGRLEQRRVERLITIARQVLKEEKP